MRYKGGVQSATANVTSGSSASGIWSMRQQFQAKDGTGWPRAILPPTTIGGAYGGGFYGGQINVSGTIYNLVVSPKATGDYPAGSGKRWGPYGTTTGINSVIDGPTNTLSMVGPWYSRNADATSYEAAYWCATRNIGGYSDWYLPAKNELEVLYYNLKPTTTLNRVGYGFGINPNAVLPEPISTEYTTTSPAQTSAVGFRDGETEAFSVVNFGYWTSTEATAGASQYAWVHYFQDSTQGDQGVKNTYNNHTRAIRRVLA
jgi:hypothetical protein